MDDDVPVSQSQSQNVLMDPAEREREIRARYDDAPINHSPALAFHTLFQDLFQPLIEENSKTKGPTVNIRQRGPDHGIMNKQEKKRAIIERYVSRWRRDVGDDFFPAFRLIVPEKDRERAMYGFKEKVLGKYLIKIMKIDRNSADAAKILSWKAPVQGSAAGDFAGRCYEVISKRPSRVEVGNMTIGDVNEQLDALSAAAREEHQLPILSNFYQQMNAEELKWLIKIILREMKIGSTEKTFFHVWHPDADSLFNISSDLRRVCWDLYNPNVRLEGENRGVALMSCYQPQLASGKVKELKKIEIQMMSTEDDAEFWVEEKLDGERMQFHMERDEEIKGGRKFKFWSRKAKEYTYLYGESLYDKNGSLTQHLEHAFASDVENIILDGEMITWDPEQDRQGAFGTLKTAALSEQKNPFAGKIRPLYRIFDILLVNNTPLTRYTLRKRREVLVRSVKPVHRRFEIHDHEVATSAEQIESQLRKVIEMAAEGLVIKNPLSAYRPGDRNNDWIKVKPEYMHGYGESIECLVIAGFYGSGRRGGGISSYLCGLRADDSKPGTAKLENFLSFCKIGGGMKAEDYDTFNHMTEGKWHDYDAKMPPTEYLQLAGAIKEKPDVWIRPEDSFVVEVKAAEIIQTDDFAAGLTLRFPRFVKLRQDRDWQTTLSIHELIDLKASRVEEETKHKMKVDEERRKKRRLMSHAKPLKVVGYGATDIDEVEADGKAGSGSVFENLTFFVMTESTRPVKKTKPQLEEMIKANGGNIVQTHTIKGVNVLCIAERRTVKVASLQKKGDVKLIKAIWLFDCIDQARTDLANGMVETVLFWETDRHLFYVPEGEKGSYEDNVDKYGDAYCRNTTGKELRELMEKMTSVPKLVQKVKEEVQDAVTASELPGWMFRGMRIFADAPTPGITDGDSYLGAKGVGRVETAKTTLAFAGATIATDVEDETVTHIVVSPSSDLKALRKMISVRKRIPRLVTTQWVSESWKEKTLIDEERYAL